MSDFSSLQHKIINLVREVGRLQGEIPLDKDLYSELGVESVDSIGILLALEERFGIAIDDTQFIKARTVKKLEALVAGTSTA